jgi:hypothetical protein
MFPPKSTAHPVLIYTIETVAFSFGISENAVFSNAIDSAAVYHLVDEGHSSKAQKRRGKPKVTCSRKTLEIDDPSQRQETLLCDNLKNRMFLQNFFS